MALSKKLRPFALSLALLASVGCASNPSKNASSQAEEPVLAQAARLIQKKETAEALKLLRKVRAQNPESVDAMRLFVEAAFRGGQIGSTIEELAQSLQVNTNSPTLHYGMGIALYAQSASQEKKALEHLELAAAVNPHSAEIAFRIGLIHLDAERFNEALTSLTRSRDLDPTASRHHISLAQAQARTGDRSGALASLKAVLELSPRPMDLKVAQEVISRLNLPFREIPKVVSEDFERGLNFMQVDAPQQAMVAFQEILQRFPDLASVHAALGLCFERIDDASRAIEELKYAIELSPSDPLNHLYLGDVYFAKERFDRAAECYRKVIEFDPLNTHAYERIGRMALQISDFDQAAESFRHLVTLSPNDVAAKISFGTALSGLGKLDEAEAIYADILKENPKNVEVLMRMGLVFMDRRKLEETNPEKARALGETAAKWFEKVLDIQPQNVFAARMLQSLAQTP